MAEILFVLPVWPAELRFSMKLTFACLQQHAKTADKYTIAGKHKRSCQHIQDRSTSRLTSHHYLTMATQLTATEILDRFYATEAVFGSSPPKTRNETLHAMLATLSPSIRVVQSPDLPYGGTYDGHAGFSKWSEEMSARFDRLDVTDRRVLTGEADNEVVVLSTLRLRIAKTGEEWIQPFAQTIEVDRSAGVISSIRPWYWNIGGLNAALAKNGQAEVAFS